jgi:hypothetical protein
MQEPRGKAITFAEKSCRAFMLRMRTRGVDGGNPQRHANQKDARHGLRDPFLTAQASPRSRLAHYQLAAAS